MRFGKQLSAVLAAVGLAGAALAPAASAQTVVGVTATEIKIGNTNPYSGPGQADCCQYRGQLLAEPHENPPVSSL
jgi:hypothetical protein